MPPKKVDFSLPAFHPKQQLFFDSKATEILWAGDTRGGKSAGVKLALCEWCVEIPGLQCDIWRLREDDVINGYYEGEFGLPALLAPLIHAKLVEHNKTEFRFWNGSLISLENCWTDAVLTKVQGIPKHVRIIDEAGQIPESRLKKLKLWMTMSEDMKAKLPAEYRERFPKIIYLMNRMGISKNYFRRVFVRSRPKYQIEKVGAFYQQYIPAKVDDNPSENIEATIERVRDAADSAMQKALLSEDGWDAQTGNYFEDWDSERHVIKPFVIPDFWLRFRTFDYGSYEPWACLWWAVSPGCKIHEGTPDERYLPRGCKVCYREWYGCKAEYPTDERDKLVTNLAPKGWSNLDIANGIIERTEKSFDNQPTFTDKFPFIKLGGRDIASDFRDAGVPLQLGIVNRENRGSQTASLLAGEKLNASSETKYPMMVFFETCKYCQDYMPMIERHEDEGRMWDYKEDGEPTHICFSGETLVKTPQGNTRIDSLVAGDVVIAGDGEARKISAAGLTRFDAKVCTLIFDNGESVTCTPDHKLLTVNGWKRAIDCMDLSVILGECESKSYRKRFSNLTGESIAFIQARHILHATKIACIEWCGNFITAKFQKACTFIIGTGTRLTTKSKTWNWLRQNIISLSMHLKSAMKNIGAILTEFDHWLVSGIARKRGELGIESIMPRIALPCTSYETSTVSTVMCFSSPPKLNQDSAPESVRKDTQAKTSFSILSGLATFAERCSKLLNIDLPKRALETVALSFGGRTARCDRIEYGARADVYCLTEPVTHSFQLASGIVVKNCDCVTLAAMTHKIVYDAPEAIDEKWMNQVATNPRNKKTTMRDVAPNIDFS